MGARKIKKKVKKNKETKLDKIIDWIQLILGIIFSIYGLIKDNSISMGMGGLLILFSRRRVKISIPFKK